MSLYGFWVIKSKRIDRKKTIRRPVNFPFDVFGRIIEKDLTDEQSDWLATHKETW